MRGETTLANYSYLSDGTKLSALDSNGNGLIYAGSLVYAKQNGTIGLESASFSGRRIVALQTSGIVSYEPRYFISDHLGSVRTVIDARGEELERSDYYPFGMRWTNADAAISDNRYRYNGKEEQGFLNIPYSDYGARMYDSELGRWFGIDQLAEKYPQISPYAFCGNNPIRRIDTDGKKWVDATGYVKYQDGNWTKYAGLQDRLLGAELQKTPTGQRRFEHLVNGLVPTQINLGMLDKGVYGKNSNQSTSKGLYTAEITLDIDNMREKAKDNGITVMQAAASTLGHEIRHTEEENIKMLLESIKGPQNVKYHDLPEEKDAHAVGDQTIYEYKNNIKPETNEKNRNRSVWDTVLDLFR